MMSLLRWRKSSRSGQATDCVEVAHTMDALRDSKDPCGDTLTTSGVGPLLDMIKRGRLDR